MDPVRIRSSHQLSPCESNVVGVNEFVWYIALVLCGSAVTVMWRWWNTKKTARQVKTSSRTAEGVGSSVLVDVGIKHEHIIELASRVQEAGKTWATEIATNSARGSIELIGTGPGDPRLLTVYAVQAINSADLVLADRLTPPAILSLVRCDMHIAKKTKGNAEQAQHELNQLGLKALREGRKVVRLKNGDPFMYGRGGEEVLFFRHYGFEAMVVPGISSSLSAAMAAGIPVTHRGVANEVCIATGQLKLGSNDPTFPEYRPMRTTVLLMAVSRLPNMGAELQKLGYPENTPVAIIENAWRPDQRVVKADIQTISAVAADHAISSPATIVIGNVISALSST